MWSLSTRSATSPVVHVVEAVLSVRPEEIRPESWGVFWQNFVAVRVVRLST